MGKRRVQVQRVQREEGAEPVVDGVAEREQAGVPEQHVVGEGEHRHDPDLAQQREREPLVEDEGRATSRASQERAPQRDAPAGEERGAVMSRALP